MGSEKKNPQCVESLAAETRLGADDATVLPGRLDRYAKAHHRALAMSDYAMEVAEGAPASLGNAYRKVAHNLRTCGSYLLFRDYYTVGKVRLHAATFCKKHLLCPLCAIRRGAKMVKAYMEKLAVLKAENPNLKAYFVTLTVKDGPDLRERFSHLYHSLQRMHKMRTRQAQGQFNESCKADAAVWSFEFGRGENSGDWHPHVHAIWLCETAPDAKKLSAEWKRSTRDSFIVDVRPFHDQDDVIDGFLEVFKYAVKFPDLSMEDNWEGYKVLSGKRLIGSFGSFRGLEIPENLADEQLDDLPYVEALYKYIYGAGYSYVKKTDLPMQKSGKRKHGPAPVQPADPYKSTQLLKLRKKYPSG